MKVRRLYKIYKDDIFMGVIKSRLVVSDFEYSQDLNTAGAQIEVEIASTLEGAGVEALTSLLRTSTGSYIVTEKGSHIILGNSFVFNQISIDLANRLKVIKFNDANPNGTTEFDGVITSWKSDYKSDNLVLKAMSWGVKLQQYLVEAAANTAVISYLTSDGETTADPFLDANSLAPQFQIAETFQVLTDTTIPGFNFVMRAEGGSMPVICQLRAGTPANPGAYLGYVLRTVSNSASEKVRFTFAATAALLGLTDYHVIIYRNDQDPSKTLHINQNSTGGYADGNLWTYAVGGSAGTGSWTSTTRDLNFELITSSGGGSIGGDYPSTDPSAIVRSLLDSFTRRGGLITYDEDSVRNTGTKTSYNFKFDTLFDGLKKCLELAPSNWYWYVDIGANILHFKRQAAVADHKFTMGKHIENIVLEYTLDDVKNVVYFSGGDTGGGDNLLRLNTNLSSQRRYGIWLDKPSDNRVTNSSTADILSQGVLNQNAKPVFRTQLSIPAAVYDIESIELGQMVGFRNANSLINSLLLQIVGVDKKTDIVTLYLQTLPPSVSHRIEDIKRNLEKQETINNPATVT